MTQITLQLARVADADEIARMSRDLIETGLGWSWTAGRVARHVGDPDTVVLVARDRVYIVGFAIMHFGDRHAHLNLLAVRLAYRRRGIGARLLDWLIASARVAGIVTVGLEVRGDNQVARRFYRCMGFDAINRIAGYYKGREPALRMVRRLASRHADGRAG